MEGDHCPTLVGSFGFLCLYEIFFPALAAVVGLVVQNTKYFCSSPYTVSLHLSPAPSKLGSQSCYVTCLSYYVSLLLAV
jgi:hypothetical protein